MPERTDRETKLQQQFLPTLLTSRDSVEKMRQIPGFFSHLGTLHEVETDDGHEFEQLQFYPLLYLEDMAKSGKYELFHLLLPAIKNLQTLAKSSATIDLTIRNLSVYVHWFSHSDGFLALPSLCNCASTYSDFWLS